MNIAEIDESKFGKIKYELVNLFKGGGIQGYARKEAKKE